MNAVSHPARDSLRLNFCGLDFGSPLVLVSGCAGFGEEYTRVEGFSNRDAGAVILPGTTLEARLGHPSHRLFETPSGLLSSIGLQNPGVDQVIRTVLPELDFTETHFIANVSGSNESDCVEVCRRFDQAPIEAIELYYDDPDRLAPLVQACRRVTHKPLIAKLSPDQTDIRTNARQCIEAGADALSLINTPAGLAIDIRSRRPVLGGLQGGLSGPAIKPLALLKVHQVYEVARRHHVPVIGQGGVNSAADAIEFIIAGASAVGIGTALFYDPLICNKINTGIRDYLQSNRMECVSDLVGTLQTGAAIPAVPVL